jgi:transposase
MLAMAQIQFIKHLRDREDFSVNGIAKKLEIDWRTAKKYADRSDWNDDPSKSSHRSRVMDLYIPIVDAWLLEDSSAPKKQRHTAKRIYDRLVEEHGFTGSDRTVRYYVAKRKQELRLEEAIPYVRLEHPGGEAQVDFGTVQVVEAGKEKTLKQLTVSLPYSNAAFPYALPAENAECFLEGLKQIFECMGGVPTKLWLDNLSAAVVTIEADGKRKLTDAFSRFALHYRFETAFCNPGKGNEKGHVENKVGYTRRNWCVPVPVISSLSELQSHLEQQALKDMDRPHYAKETLIRTLWEEESVKLLKLPTVPYDVFRLEPAKINTYGEVKLDGQTFPVGGLHPGETVLLKIRWNQADVLDNEYRKVAVLPRPYMNQAVCIEWKPYLKMFRTKPRSLPYSALFKLLPESVRIWLTHSKDDQKNRISWLVRMFDHYTMDHIAQVLEHPSEDLTALEHRLYRLRNPENSFLPIVEGYTPTALVGLAPDLSPYDRLRKRVTSR